MHNFNHVFQSHLTKFLYLTKNACNFAHMRYIICLSVDWKHFRKRFQKHSYIFTKHKTRKGIKEGGFIIMRKMKRLLAAGLATIMACSMLTGCGGGSSDKKASSDKDSSKGSVYYLNFKPEAEPSYGYRRRRISSSGLQS